MSRVVIVGGGPIGLATGILLARDGHRTTVLEKDPDRAPETWPEAWDRWQRRGVAQFRQAHFMHAKFRHGLDAEFPNVRRRIEALGGRHFDMLSVLPRSIADRSPRPGDERFETLTARRPVLESAFAQAAEETPGLEILRGVGVEGPLSDRTTRSGIPHVTGVRTESGREIAADLVIDAMGRRSKLPDWVIAIGGRPPYEEASDAGFAYYTRHYASRDGTVPSYRGPVSTPVGTVQTLTILADNNTWTVSLLAMAGDGPLKLLRHNEVWERVARAMPHAAHWLDGDPLCDVMPMAGVLDRYRRIVVDGEPVVTGLLPVGDAWACTNPSAGRGLSIGLGHAICVRDAVRAQPDDPIRLAKEFDRTTEEQLTPWYRDQVNRDRQRALVFQALVEGREPGPPAGDPAVAAQAALLAGVGADPDLARGWFDILSCLALPAEVFARPGIQDKLSRFIGKALPPVPGPTRAELLGLLN